MRVGYYLLIIVEPPPDHAHATGESQSPFPKARKAAPVPPRPWFGSNHVRTNGDELLPNAHDHSASRSGAARPAAGPRSACVSLGRVDGPARHLGATLSAHTRFLPHTTSQRRQLSRRLLPALSHRAPTLLAQSARGAGRGLACTVASGVDAPLVTPTVTRPGGRKFFVTSICPRPPRRRHTASYLSLHPRPAFAAAGRRRLRTSPALRDSHEQSNKNRSNTGQILVKHGP
jgi:hypothetical protein